MVCALVRHNVEDYQAWRKRYDEFDQVRRSMGVVGTAVFQSDPLDNPQLTSP